MTTQQISQQTTLLDMQAKQLSQRATSGALTAVDGSTVDDAKAIKAGRDFESILVGSWLQQAENSFATVPGGDEDEDADAGKDQFQGIAMQALAGSLTKSGSFGIAKMVTEHLRNTIQAAAAVPQTAALGLSATAGGPQKVE